MSDVDKYKYLQGFLHDIDFIYLFIFNMTTITQMLISNKCFVMNTHEKDLIQFYKFFRFALGKKIQITHKSSPAIEA